MPDLNPNIILGFQPPAPGGSLDMAGKFLGLKSAQAGLANTQAQNALLQNENTSFQQKQAAGQIVSNALMRHTNAAGNTDFGGVKAEIAQSGAGNPAIGEAYSQAIGQQSAQTGAGIAGQQLTQQQIATNLAHINMIATTLSGVAAKPNPTVNDVAGAVADAASHADNGDPDLAAKGAGLVASLPPNATGEQVKAAIMPYLVQAQSAQGQLQALTGTPTAINNGAGTTIQSINPVAGTVSPMAGPSGAPAFIPNQLTPGEKTNRVGYVDAQGIPHSVPQAALSDSEGNPTANSMGLTQGLAPGQQGTLEANAGRAQAIQHDALTAQPRIAAYSDIRASLPNAPNTSFGPTGELTSKVGKLAAAFGVGGPNIANGQASIDELTKSLNLIASQQASTLGAGTDASRATVEHSNPSLSNSKAGLMQNLAVVQGNDEFAQAKNLALQQWMKNHPASSTPQFETMFNSKVSPLVFQTQHMDAANQKAVFNNLTGTKNKDGSYSGDKGKFLKALDFGQSQGWFGQ